MKFKKTDYILGVWYAEKLNNDNWMATVKTSDPNHKEWDLEYRFRYIKDDKIWDSKDKKNFYSAKISGLNEDQVKAKVDLVFELIKSHYNLRSKFIEVKGDMDRFMFKMAQEDIMHFKRGEKCLDCAGSGKGNGQHNECIQCGGNGVVPI